MYARHQFNESYGSNMMDGQFSSGYEAHQSTNRGLSQGGTAGGRQIKWDTYKPAYKPEERLSPGRNSSPGRYGSSSFNPHMFDKAFEQRSPGRGRQSSPYRMSQGSPHRYSDKNTFQSSSAGGYMASQHSEYRASSPARQGKDYLAEAQSIGAGAGLGGQDKFLSQYRPNNYTNIQDASPAAARQYSPYRGRQASPGRTQESNLPSSYATFGMQEKLSNPLSQERSACNVGMSRNNFDYNMPSRSYGTRTQPTQAVGESNFSQKFYGDRRASAERIDEKYGFTSRPVSSPMRHCQSLTQSSDGLIERSRLLRQGLGTDVSPRREFKPSQVNTTYSNQVEGGGMNKDDAMKRVFDYAPSAQVSRANLEISTAPVQNTIDKYLRASQEDSIDNKRTHATIDPISRKNDQLSREPNRYVPSSSPARSSNTYEQYVRKYQATNDNLQGQISRSKSTTPTNVSSGYSSKFAYQFQQNSTTDGRYNDVSRYGADRQDYTQASAAKVDYNKEYGYSAKKEASPTAYDKVIARKERKPFNDTRNKDLDQLLYGRQRSPSKVDYNAGTFNRTFDRDRFDRPKSVSQYQSSMQSSYYQQKYGARDSFKPQNQSITSPPQVKQVEVERSPARYQPVDRSPARFQAVERSPSNFQAPKQVSPTFPTIIEQNEQTIQSQPHSGVPLKHNLSLHDESIQQARMDQTVQSIQNTPEPKAYQTIQTPEKTPAKSAKSAADAKSATPSPGKKTFLQNIMQSMSPGHNETAEAK